MKCLINDNLYSRKHKPYIRPIAADVVDVKPNEEDTKSKEKEGEEDKEKDIGEVSKITVTLKKTPENETVVAIEEKELLTAPYAGQYVIYTNDTQAWLLLYAEFALVVKWKSKISDYGFIEIVIHPVLKLQRPF